MTSSANRPDMQDGEQTPDASKPLRFDRRGGQRRPAMGWLALLHHPNGPTLRLDRQFNARMIDLSETGMGLRTDRPLNDGDCLTALMQPHGFRPGFDMPARVAWCEADNDGSYRVGVEFLRKDAA